MNRVTKTFVGYLWIIVSLAAVVALAGTLYWLETERRETYFNQLMFRQLGEVALGFDNNLASLKTLMGNHARLVESDLHDIRRLRNELVEHSVAATTLPYSARKLDLLRSQGQLLMFSAREDATDACRPRPWVEVSSDTETWCATNKSGSLRWFAGNLAKRDPDLPGCPDPPYDDNNYCQGLESLSQAMTFASCIARKPIAEVAEHRDTLDRVITRLEGLEITPKNQKTPDRIRQNLLGTLQNLSAKLRGPITVADGHLTDGNEKLPRLVQRRISRFWAGESCTGQGITEKAYLGAALASAAPGDIEKSLAALDQIIDLVERRYLDKGSQLESSVESHRLGLYLDSEPRSEAASICRRHRPKEPFVVKSKRASPYPSGHFSLGGCPFDADVAYVGPFETFLNQNVAQFSTLMTADQNGDVLYSTSSASSAGHQDFINVRELIASEPVGAASQNNPGADATDIGLTQSGFVTREIGGIQYRLYAMPHRLGSGGLLRFSNLTEHQDVAPGTAIGSLVFIGLVPISNVRAYKLSLTPITSVVLSSIGLGILLAFVFLKIKWVALGYAFTPGDRRAASLAVITMTLLASVGAGAMILSNTLRNDFENDANYTISRIQKNFDEELHQTFSTVKALLASGTCHAPIFTPSEPSARQRSDTCKSKPVPINSMFGEVEHGWYIDSALFASYGFDNIFTLNKYGEVHGELIRGTKQLVQPILRPNLAQRRYFQSASHGNTWSVPINGDAAQNLVIERIFNVSDGALSTQFAMPTKGFMPESAAHLADAIVLSFGTSMQSLMSPVLSGRLQYAIIDDATGKVLYHSRSDRSLVEDFFQETENNPALLSYIKATGSNRVNPEANEQQIDSFTGLYRGERARFFPARVHAGIPWTLVVFHELEYEQAFSSLFFGLSIFIASALLLSMALIAFLAKLLYRDLFVWLWPQIDLSVFYQKLAAAIGCAAVFLLVVLMALPSLTQILCMTIAGIGLLVLVLQRIFARKLQATPVTPNVRGTRHVQRQYTLFLLSVLVFATVVPTVAISKKVGEDLLNGLELYDGFVYRERVERHAQHVAARLARRGEMSGRLSTAPVTHYIHTKDATQDGNEILIRDTVVPDQTTQQAAGLPPQLDPVFRGFLLNIAKVWEHAALVAALFDNQISSTQAAGQDAINSHSEATEVVLTYRWPTIYQVFSRLDGWTALTLFIGFLLFLFFVIRFLAVRLLGIAVPRSYRMPAQIQGLSMNNWESFVQQSANQQSGRHELTCQLGIPESLPIAALLIRPINRQFSVSGMRVNGAAAAASGNHQALDIQKIVSDDVIRDDLIEFANTQTDVSKLLLLQNIESVAFKKQQRLKLLPFLEEAVFGSGHTSVVILCDVSPLYMLTKQDCYLHGDCEENSELADEQEVIRWSRLLSQFRKYYDWDPQVTHLSDPSRPQRALLREVTVWPELYALVPLYHTVVGKTGQALSEEQTIQFVGTHAGAEYRRRWELCTQAERLILYQLATGLMVNPVNIEPLEHLMRRGYVVRNPRWSIANKSFARFVLSAEPESVFLEWMNTSQEGLWKLVKAPLFGLAFVIIGIVIWSSQEEWNSFLALSTGLLTLIPLVLRNISLIKNPGSNLPSE